MQLPIQDTFSPLIFLFNQSSSSSVTSIILLFFFLFLHIFGLWLVFVEFFFIAKKIWRKNKQSIEMETAAATKINNVHYITRQFIIICSIALTRKYMAAIDAQKP